MRIFPKIVLGILLVSNALTMEQVQTPVFTLPDDKTQWQEVTWTYLGPVLKGEQARTRFQELLDMTMPIDGQFEEVDSVRRAKTISFTYDRLLALPESEHSAFIGSLHNRHRVYVKK